jgi:hypothetical protein
MWANTFDRRLNDWYSLRSSLDGLDTEESLTKINQWWYQSPWNPYYLHWDDIDNWPNPWNLLNENVFCDLARSLGMIYTITLLERSDLSDAKIVETKSGHNLLLVDESRYILNWDQNFITDVDLDISTINRSLSQDYIREKCL